MNPLLRRQVLPKPPDLPARHPIGPIAVTAATLDEALGLTEQLARSGRARYFCFCEANLLSHALTGGSMRAVLSDAAAVFADGGAVWLLAWLHGVTLPQRVTGPAFMPAACRYGVVRHWRHFFCGGKPGVADELAARFGRAFPGLNVVGTASPSFGGMDSPEDRRILNMINDCEPDLLWLALGSPRQELWASRYAPLLRVGLILPVGAAFDFHSGTRAWAPCWIRKRGLEWLFRSLTGGRRVFLRNLKCIPTVGAFLVQTAIKQALRRAACPWRGARQQRIAQLSDCPGQRSPDVP